MLELLLIFLGGARWRSYVIPWSRLGLGGIWV